MSYWLFQANPKKYRVIEALAERNEIRWWQVNQHAREIHEGDGVLIWMAGKDAGVYAIAEVMSEPLVVGESDPFWAAEDKEGAEAPRLRVKLRVLHLLLDGPVLRSTLLEDPALNELSILRFHQGTNFPVSEEEWTRILQLAGLSPREQTAQDTEPHLDVAEIHLRQAIARNLAQIAPGLTPFFEERVEEYPVPNGRIDLLCKDADGRPVVVELKRQHWNTDKAIGQITRYMGWARQSLENGELVRGILLIPDDGTIDQRLEDAKKAVPGLEIRRYSITFQIT